MRDIDKFYIAAGRLLDAINNARAIVKSDHSQAASATEAVEMAEHYLRLGLDCGRSPEPTYSRTD